jgi:hypothetical protein
MKCWRKEATENKGEIRETTEGDQYKKENGQKMT